MVRMLVTTASKHGATREIGEAIAAALVAEGVEVVVRPVDEVAAIDDADAVIVGSGVYAGRWLASARRFVERFGEGLRQRSVWLFSSGPLGTPPAPEDVPLDIATVMEATSARGHRVFSGRLARERLNVGERAIVKMVRAPYGDYREWPEITTWAREIADSLKVGARDARSDESARGSSTP